MITKIIFIFLGKPTFFHYLIGIIMLVTLRIGATGKVLNDAITNMFCNSTCQREKLKDAKLQRRLREQYKNTYFSPYPAEYEMRGIEKEWELYQDQQYRLELDAQNWSNFNMNN